MCHVQILRGMERWLKMQPIRRSKVLLAATTIVAFLIGLAFRKTTPLTAEFIVDHQSEIVGRLGVPLGQVVQLTGVIERIEPTKESGKNSFTFRLSHIDGKRTRTDLACLERDMQFASDADFYKMSLGSNVKCYEYESLQFYGDPLTVNNEEIIAGPSIGLHLVHHISQVEEVNH